MMLFFEAHDLLHCTLGIVEHTPGTFTFLHGKDTIPSAPEGYLGLVDSYLLSRHIPWERIDGILLVGEGSSATALRVSHAIMNALAFTKRIPLFSVNAALQEPLRPVAVALPRYAQGAQVTVSSRDALKRRA